MNKSRKNTDIRRTTTSDQTGIKSYMLRSSTSEEKTSEISIVRDNRSKSSISTDKMATGKSLTQKEPSADTSGEKDIASSDMKALKNLILELDARVNQKLRGLPCFDVVRYRPPNGTPTARDTAIRPGFRRSWFRAGP